MSLFSWWRNWGGVRSAAVARFKHGLARAKQHDDKSAAEYYSAAIDMANVPDDVKGMALYNRALVHASGKDFGKAIVDLNAVLALAAPLRQIKSAARQKLDRIHRAQGVNETMDRGGPGVAAPEGI